MLRNYITIAIRNLHRHAGYALLNILGLSIGLTCCILLVLYIQHELSYDRFHRNSDQLYRLVGDRFAPTPAPWAPALVRDFPEVLAAVRVKTPFSRWYVRAGDRRFWEKGFYFADAAFFDMFSFPLLAGNPNTVLAAPNAVVISESAAHKYFGNEDPVGKTLTIENQFEITVTGVMQDMPANSHFRCDFLTSFASLEADHRWSGNITDFATQGFNLHVYTYLLMQKDYPADTFSDKIPAFLRAHLGDKATAGMLSQRFSLQRITDIYLHSALEAEIGVMSDIAYVYIFGTLAFFVILLACINFTNLSTARAAIREKEVGIRKVVGAQRRQLIGQFMGEALCLTTLSLILSLVLADLTILWFSELAGRQLTIDYADGWLWLMLAGITLFTGILAGSYPALFLSALKPVGLVRGPSRSGFAGTFGRKMLVVLQFTLSIVMIIGTGVSARQMSYIRNKTLGYDTEQLVVVPLATPSVRERYPAFREALIQQAGIVQVAGSSSRPGEQTFGRYGLQETGAMNVRQGVAALYTADYTYVETLGIELSEGRNFSGDTPSDVREAALINESAVRALGLTAPIGAQIELSVPLTRTVIGVVRDFHAQTLHHPIEPVVLLMGLEDTAPYYAYFVYALIRVRGDRLPQALAVIRQTWDNLYPDFPFEYSFLDQDLENQYRTEQRMQHIFGVAALVSVVIACLGVFGMASFMVERRTRELGIRKVIGASKRDLLRLLSGEYVRLILLANLIAWPIAYAVMQRWLQLFAYRITPEPATFILTGLLTLAITLATTGYHAARAVRINPVEALRAE